MSKIPLFRDDRDAQIFQAGMRTGSLGGQQAALEDVLAIIDRYKIYDQAGSDEILTNLRRDIVAELTRLREQETANNERN